MLAKELREQWNNMTEAERDEATKESKEKLEEDRGVRRYAPHNVALAAFHDSRSHLSAVHTRVSSFPLQYHPFLHLASVASRTQRAHWYGVGAHRSALQLRVLPSPSNLHLKSSSGQLLSNCVQHHSLPNVRSIRGVHTVRDSR